MKKIDLVYKVSIISIIINVVLFTIKIIAGLLGNSKAIISDAIHSLSDILSTIVVMIGIFMSRKKSDDKHPYGHEKFECIAAIILAAMLFIIGIGIGLDGLKVIINNSYNSLDKPGVIALIAAIISIVIKEWMYKFTFRASIIENSNALKADAWHHRSDALSSIGALIGIGFSLLGYPIFDSIASIIIALFIIKAAYDILKDGFDKMIDASASKEIISEIINIIETIDGVKRIDNLKTRLFGSKIYIDLEIAVDGNLTVIESHKIAHNVHDEIEEKIKNCKHCMIHINPFEES